MDKSIPWTTEKTEVSSANSYVVDERLWLRSFMYIRKKSGPKIDPWVTTASIGEQEMPDHAKERADIYHLKNTQ